MQARLLALAFGAMAAFAATSFGQMPSASAPPLQVFQGTASQATAAFQVPDSWEVRWSSHRSLNISVMAGDGSVIAGAAGSRGALYVSKGGTYHLQIDEAPAFLMPGMPNPAEPNRSPTPFENTINGNNGGANNNAAPNNASPSSNNYPPGASPMNPAAFANMPYAVEVVTAANAAATSSVSPTMPSFKLPDGVNPTALAAAGMPAPTPAPPATPGKLSEDQARAVVLIKGDKAEGTGFIVKTPTGPAVITNIHVIADNPNLKITTNTGAFLTVVSQKCASDRDLAMLAIQDNGYSTLDMAPDISAVVRPGDEVITPGNSQGGEVMLNTSGKVLGVGPERIEIDNPIYHGNSGGPVFHPKSGKVLGVVTEAEKVDLSNDLDKTSFASRNSAISGAIRYFALRLDTVTEWVDIDPAIFRAETAFLDQFEEQSRRLDAYLNTSDSNNNNPNGNTSQSDAKIYLDDEKIMRAENNYQSTSNGGDTAQHLEALRSLLFDLQSVADLNVDKIQNMSNFYTFDRDRARDEMAYRKALKDELDSIGSHIERLSHMPRTNN